jgi:hypothetical protein
MYSIYKQLPDSLDIRGGEVALLADYLRKQNRIVNLLSVQIFHPQIHIYTYLFNLWYILPLSHSPSLTCVIYKTVVIGQNF